MELRKILVATDFSTEATRAVEHAMTLAALRGAELTIAHVFEAGTSAAAVFTHDGGSASLIASLLEHEATRRREALELLRRRAEERDITAHVQLLEGHADEAICRSAETHDFDLVVMGTRGRTGFAKVLLGSVATSVAKRCHAPVYIARRAAPLRFQRILVALDLLEGSENLVEAAMTLAAPTASLELLHVHTAPLSLRDHQHNPLPDGIIARGEELLTAATTMRSCIKTSFSVERDVPGHGVLRRVERDRHDLVVVGRSHRNRLRRLLLGSVAERIARHAPCPVLVAPTEIATPDTVPIESALQSGFGT